MTDTSLQPDGRPNPDALLAQIKADEPPEKKRGKLKVFFGAAAGVGKTFAMLEQGRAKAAENVNVLVGYAEPHIRTDTEALLLGMEILPYKTYEYRGVQLKEFDLDGALARKPALVLVDELAHTNAPGMRHAKRYQDVLELLDAGIDVFTTLNVQHLESVNDIVERITSVKVRETLPDSILDEADEVELVDTSPEELLERLNEGKVYRPDMAERAMRHFFTKGNLIALREMALRRTAERVDAQMQDFRRDHAVRQTWAASERILVCVGPSPLSAKLIRASRRLASGLKAQWIAAYVETSAAAAMPQTDRDRVTQNLRLAQQLGAKTVTLTGENVAEEVINYAQTHNVTKIVAGKPEKSRWRELLRRSLVDDLVRRSGDIDIYIIRAQAEAASPQPPRRPRSAFAWMGYAWAMGIVALCTGVDAIIFRQYPRVAEANLVMIYLLGVVITAVRFGREPALLASLVSVLAFDFCFVPPRLRLAVSDTQYLVVFAVMLIVAVVISTLTDRVRQQAQAARQRLRRTAALFELSRELAGARGVQNIMELATQHIADVFDGQAVVFLADEKGHLAMGTSHPAGFIADDKENSVAQWVFEHEQTAGCGTATLPAARAMYLPLVVSRGAVGVLGLCPAQQSRLQDLEQLRLLESFANQSALAIERAKLAEEAQAAWERVEAEFMRNTLLSSVSHDLRTPLAAITGAASTLADSAAALPQATRVDLLETIRDQSERMERLINNLLDMTRLESGGLVLRKEWQPLAEIVGSALRHLRRRLAGHEVRTDLPGDLPMVEIDASAMEQVLVNLVDNAAEYTPSGSCIDISASANGYEMIVEVADGGPGLPPGTEKRIFEKFFRARPEQDRRGLGLGLAICRSIVQAHGGQISAANRPEGGAVFRFVLPMGSPPAITDSLEGPLTPTPSA